MLYLLHPHHPLRFNAHATLGPGAGPRENEYLEHLEWNAAGEVLDAVLVRLALRHGHAYEHGIVLQHLYVTLRDGVARWNDALNQPAEPDEPDEPGGRSAYPEPPVLPEPPAELGHAYRDRIRRFDAQLRRDRRSMRDRARRRLDDALGAPPVPALVAHWLHLGAPQP